MKKLHLFLLILLTTSFFVGCDESEENFDNKIYLKASSKVDETIIKGDAGDIEKTIQSSLSNPESKDVEVSYEIDLNKVDTYNKAYYDDAKMLPSENYELTKSNVSIPAGSILSEETSIIFKNLSSLDRETVFVLPVSISTSTVQVLESARTLYYVFKAGSLINVVADIEENYLLIDWENADVANNLNQVTMEALVRARDFDRKISTVMGIEGYFLIRVGDSGFPPNQVQVATSQGKFPDGDTKKALQTNEFVHIALTYDSSDNGKMILYVNGKVQGETNQPLGALNLGKGGINGFSIGRSYADSRYFAGDISEVRIWNIVRTKEEIANNPYAVDPHSEGLVSYWKFDDEEALSVKDYTGNNNNAIANSPLTWRKVELPEPNQ